MGHVRNSAKNGAAGGRTTTLLKRAGYSKKEITESINSTGNKVVDIDHVYLEGLFHSQNGKCYHLQTVIDPMDVFISNHPLSPSVDRIDNSLGYVKGNVVITTRFANRGRETADDKWFRECCIPRLLDGMSNNRQLPNLENFYI